MATHAKRFATESIPSDPLAKAFTAVLMPHLRPLGFRRKTRRFVCGIVNSIYQDLACYGSAYNGEIIRVSCGSESLFVPRDILGGGQWIYLESESSEWYKGETLEKALD